MNVAEMMTLSDQLHAEAAAMEKRIVLGTREEWNALKCIQDAAHALYSAASWLTPREPKPQITEERSD
jgi:hypothetical protein